MTRDVLVLLAGLGCAAAGGELFVRGAVGVATRLRIPGGIVGATVVAFATSSPELAVGIASARSGTPGLALGDALGSNVVNVGLVLGLVLLLGTLATTRQAGLRRDVLFALALPALLAVLALDETISRADGGVLLVVFLLWLVLTTLEARRERSAATADAIGEERGRGRLVAVTVAGIALLVLAGRLIVAGARPIGTELGLDPFVVGVVIVAVGTSAPELATALVARLRGHGEIGLGNVIGSNVFNGGFIVAVVALIQPIRFELGEIAVGLAYGLGLVALLAVAGAGRLGRPLGLILVAAYVASVATLLATAR
ncbi:MAG: calcium/sodium antiporter [Thermoleophilia bacterium]